MLLKIFLLFLSLTSVLFSKHLTLFTEPKTGSHLIYPILKNLGIVHFQLSIYNHISIDEISIFPNKTPYNASHQGVDLFFPDLRSAAYDIASFVYALHTSAANNFLLSCHPPHTRHLENLLLTNDFCNIYIVRDPRDVAISILNHYKKFGLPASEASHLSVDREQELFTSIIRNSRTRFLSYTPWIDSPASCVLYFDKLMGSHGGAATDQDAINEIKKILKILQVTKSDAVLMKAYKASFGASPYFVKGKVGVWKDYFTDADKQLFKEVMGDLLVEYGFAENQDW